MKISTDTLAVLKNFAAINSGILIRPGNILQTRTPAVFAEAIITEEFPVELGIYDLVNLLGVIGLFNDPEFEFGKESLRIAESDGKAETRYAYAAAGLVALPVPKKKRKELTEQIINFTLSEDQWIKLQKATSVFDRHELKITSDGNFVRMGTANHKHEHGNSFSMILEAEPHGHTCNMIFNKDHLNLLKGSYQGIVTPDYTIFKNTSGYELTYFVGVEPTTSTFGASSHAA